MNKHDKYIAKKYDELEDKKISFDNLVHFLSASKYLTIKDMKWSSDPDEIADWLISNDIEQEFEQALSINFDKAELKKVVKEEVDNFYSIAPKYRTKKRLVKNMCEFIIKIVNGKNEK